MKLAKLDKLLFFGIADQKHSTNWKKRVEETVVFRDSCYKVSRSKGKGHVMISRLGV